VSIIRDEFGDAVLDLESLASSIGLLILYPQVHGQEVLGFSRTILGIKTLRDSNF